MTNEQLVTKIKAGEDAAANMEQLCSQVESFIRSIAWRYRGYEEMDDLVQEGLLALYPAIDGFDPASGYKFLTYAEYHIRQRIRRYIQNNGSCLRFPIQCLEKIRKYDLFCQSFLQEHGRKPTDGECSYYLGVTLEQIKTIRENACMANLGSLDAPVIGKDGGEDGTIGDFAADPFDLEEDTLNRMQQEELSAVLWECVDSLEGQQPDVIRKRYQGGMTLAEIGRQQGSTPEAVRQIQAKALRELRKTEYSGRLGPFLPDYERIYSAALVGGGVTRFNRTWTSSTERVALGILEG